MYLVFAVDVLLPDSFLFLLVSLLALLFVTNDIDGIAGSGVCAGFSQEGDSVLAGVDFSCAAGFKSDFESCASIYDDE